MSYRFSSPVIDVYADNGVLVVRTPYDPMFVDMLKRYIPAAERSFDKARRVWLVTPAYGDKVAELIDQCFGQVIRVPAINAQPEPEMRVLDVRYIGQAKDRGAGERIAYAWMNGGWNALFSESALRGWFGGEDSRSSDDTTLYGVLGIKLKSDETEIKAAYRRMARQWHPDVCHEPNAAEMFRAVQHAYDVLRDVRMRARYDVGLKMSGETPVIASGMSDLYVDGYRSPLRCGLVLAEGLNKLGKFSVTKITQWADITDSRGRTLVSSWPMDADVPEENWYDN